MVSKEKTVRHKTVIRYNFSCYCYASMFMSHLVIASSAPHTIKLRQNGLSKKVGSVSRNYIKPLLLIKCYLELGNIDFEHKLRRLIGNVVNFGCP